MNSKSKLKKKILYVIFVILALVVIGVFGYFGTKFSKIDKNKYQVSKDSVLYTSSNSFVKVEGDALLSQKLDGYYYLSDKYDNASHITKIAKTAISSSETETIVYIFGVAYSVDKNGEVLIVDGKTEVSKSSPSKFYKIDDRKYLFVDSDIASDDGVIKTNGYLIIELDKEGNASFANNLINFKTIKPVVIKGSTLEFDIANELLKNGNNVIELKKVLGSTNTYSKDKQLYDPSKSTEDNSDDTNNSNNNSNNNSGGNNSGNSGNGGSGSGGSGANEKEIIESLDYYGQYFEEVINSVNNLTNSVTGVNEKTNQSVKKNEIYFDFSKWLALKSVTPTINSVTLDYQVFDPNNEYQSVFVLLKSDNKVERKINLNKDNTSAIIGNLDYNSMYTIDFCSQSVGSSDYTVTDSIVFVTKKPEVSITIDKVSTERVYFTLKTLNFKLDSGLVTMYENDVISDKKEIDVDKAASSGGFSGYLLRNGISNNTEIKITNAMYNENIIDLDISSKFVD